MNRVMDWVKFKNISEKKFKTSKIEECWGFQIQKNTTWNCGLKKVEIEQLEKCFGFSFPEDYIEMLESFNGFETLQISIDPEGNTPDEFDQMCYKYPNDLYKTKWLLEEVKEHFQTAKEVLQEQGFNSNQIEGFIPLYGQRALVVFKDKKLSPVLSIVGNDIVIYGKSLFEYWHNEFELDYK